MDTVIFLLSFCGLTGLASSEMLHFIYSKLKLDKNKNIISTSHDGVITAIRCITESKQSSCPDHPDLLFGISDNMYTSTLLHYDYLCISYVLSCYPISRLRMKFCHIDNKGAELLVRHYPNNNTTGQLLNTLILMNNELTSEGLVHIMKIVRASEPKSSCI